MMTVLISLGADADISNDEGRPLIDIAKDQGNNEVTEILQQEGAA